MRIHVLAVLLVSCTHRESPHAEPVTLPASSAIEDPIDPGLAPLGGELVETVDDVKVSVPLGATEPRPLIVAAHGACDRPEWACAGWRGVTDGHAFIACPHGGPLGGGYAWDSLEQIEARVLDAEAKARARFGAYVDPGPIILVGFSQGSRLVSVIARRHPDRYPVVALLEGGYDETTWGFGPAFAKGGKRILFACSTWHCAKGFEAGVKSSQTAHVDARLADLGNLGHHMDARIQKGLHAHWRWLVRDDARWEHWLESPASSGDRVD
jgi:pimeloyl-ACP methyl ester carboxylesterase